MTKLILNLYTYIESHRLSRQPGSRPYGRLGGRLRCRLRGRAGSRLGGRLGGQQADRVRAPTKRYSACLIAPGAPGLVRACELTPDAPDAGGRQKTTPGRFWRSGISPGGREPTRARFRFC